MTEDNCISMEEQLNIKHSIYCSTITYTKNLQLGLHLYTDFFA